MSSTTIGEKTIHIQRGNGGRAGGSTNDDINPPLYNNLYVLDDIHVYLFDLDNGNPRVRDGRPYRDNGSGSPVGEGQSRKNCRQQHA